MTVITSSREIVMPFGYWWQRHLYLFLETRGRASGGMFREASTRRGCEGSCIDWVKAAKAWRKFWSMLSGLRACMSTCLTNTIPIAKYVVFPQTFRQSIECCMHSSSRCTCWPRSGTPTTLTKICILLGSSTAVVNRMRSVTKNGGRDRREKNLVL